MSFWSVKTILNSDPFTNSIFYFIMTSFDKWKFELRKIPLGYLSRTGHSAGQGTTRYFHFLSIFCFYSLCLPVTSKTFLPSSLCHITSTHIFAFIDVSLVSYVHPGFWFFVWFVLHWSKLLKSSQCRHNGLCYSCHVAFPV